MSIFDPRENIKPYEYPQLLQYKDAIRQSYWIAEEFMSEMISDVQDFKIKLSKSDQQIISRTMMAISQVEINVKRFWADIYNFMPKPEIASVGYSFSESEVRHMDAYSEVIELLGLNDEFKKICEVGAIKDRITYFKKYQNGPRVSQEKYTKSIFLFSLFVENVSLFGQFLIMLSYKKYRNQLKGISNAVSATCHEERLHGLFGIELINIIREEYPEYFNEDFSDNIDKFLDKAFNAEVKILDWIFESGELEFLPKVQIEEFLKNRFNESLTSVGFPLKFEVDKEILKQTEWFNEELYSSKHDDFFNTRPTAYSKKNKSFTVEDLF